jgi:hypothetical protein
MEAEIKVEGWRLEAETGPKPGLQEFASIL